MARGRVETPYVNDPDPVSRAKALSELHDSVLGEERTRYKPRPIVSESWRRSLAAKVNPDRRTPPVVYRPDEIAEIRASHPLGAVMPLLRDTLVSIADEAMHVMLVTDAEGHVLWRDGATKLLIEADRVGLFPGTQWSESAIGTNAMGTTLAVDAPVQIHSAEHLVRTYHTWTCVAAPVHDPDTGCILGAIDISGPLHTVHPALVQLISTTARLAEHQLREQLAIADARLRERNMPHLRNLKGAGALLTPTGRLLASEPAGWWPERVELPDGLDGEHRIVLPNGREALVEPLAEGYLLREVHHGPTPHPPERALTLRVLGPGPPSLVFNSRRIPLSLRPAEILTLLSLHPEGLTGKQLGQLLYGEHGNETTVRGEIHRLRALLGASVLRTRPYRLAATVDSDVNVVRRALREGDLRAALRACAGELLPYSEAPEIRAVRDELTAGLRGAVLASLDIELLVAFTEYPLGVDDSAAYERLSELLPPGDPRWGSVLFHRARLDQD